MWSIRRSQSVNIHKLDLLSLLEVLRDWGEGGVPAKGKGGASEAAMWRGKQGSGNPKKF